MVLSTLHDENADFSSKKYQRGTLVQGIKTNDVYMVTNSNDAILVYSKERSHRIGEIFSLSKGRAEPLPSNYKVTLSNE
jgi:hypothetical protein